MLMLYWEKKFESQMAQFIALPGNIGKVRKQLIFLLKCVRMHPDIKTVLHPDVPWLHRHNENGSYAK